MQRDVFRAISDPTRRDIIMSLSTKTMNVNSIAEQYSMSRSAVSQHIKVLEECGIVSITQQGKERFCTIEAQALRPVQDWLSEFRKLWEERFGELDALLERLKKAN